MEWMLQTTKRGREKKSKRETEQPTNPEQGFGEKKDRTSQLPPFCRTFLAPELGNNNLNSLDFFCRGRE